MIRPRAAAAAYVDGELVLDERGSEWPDGAIVHVASATKPIAAFCVHLLADRGVLELDDPLAKYWPELRHETTVRQALAHQAGLLAFREPQPLEALTDWDRCVGLIEQMEPWWVPGAAHGEHALLYGHLAGELVRRVDGRTLGTFWREEVAEPWRLNFAIGQTLNQVPGTYLRVGCESGWREEMLAGQSETYGLAIDNPRAILDPDVINGDAWRQAEVPAVNGHGDALAIARFYAGLLGGGELDGVRLCRPETVAAAVEPQMTAPDLLLGNEVTWALGFI